MGYSIRAANLQKRSVGQVQDLGGFVYYDFQQKADGGFDLDATSKMPGWLLAGLGRDFFHAVVKVDLPYPVFSRHFGTEDNSSSRLEFLVNFPKVTWLNLGFDQATDADMEYASKLKKLKFLAVLIGQGVTDTGAGKLERLNQLQHLMLFQSQITDKSLEVFSRMPRITHLHAPQGRFSDAGVGRLASLKGLVLLTVCGTKDQANEVTGESLQFLLERPTFHSLNVKFTNVSQDFENRLKARFPHCYVAR